MFTYRSFFAFAGLLLCFAEIAAPASAQYPDRPIRFIVGYPAGGSTDIAARIVAERMQRSLGKPITVENIGGAAGSAGVQRAIHAEPDGYSVLLAGNSELLINKEFQPHLTYDALRDLRPIGMAATGPIVLVARSGLGIRTWDALIGRGGPEVKAVTYGTNGVGSIQHLGGLMLWPRSGANVAEIPYRGSGQMMNDLLAGQIDLGIAALASARSQIEAGTVRALLVFSERRSELLPDVPAAVEKGLSSVVLDTWIGLFVPAGTSDAVSNRLEEALATALADGTVVEKLAVQGLSAREMTPRPFADFIRMEAAKYKKAASANQPAAK